MYWIFVVIVIAIAFFSGIMVGFAMGDDNRNE